MDCLRLENSINHSADPGFSLAAYSGGLAPGFSARRRDEDDDDEVTACRAVLRDCTETEGIIIRLISIESVRFNARFDGDYDACGTPLPGNDDDDDEPAGKTPVTSHADWARD